MLLQMELVGGLARPGGNLTGNTFLGAIRDVVGIWSGAISDIVKLQHDLCVVLAVFLFGFSYSPMWVDMKRALQEAFETFWRHSSMNNLRACCCCSFENVI